MTLLSMVAWGYIGYRVGTLLWPIDSLIAIGGALACANVILGEIDKASS
jgi:hypothetical protein